MADLPYKQAAQATKIVGVDPTTSTDTNFLNVDANGSGYTALRDSSANVITSTAISSKWGLDVNILAQTAFNDNNGTGTITAAGQTVVAITTGTSTVTFNTTGTWVGTLQIEGTLDGTTFFPLHGFVNVSGQIVTSFTANLGFSTPCGGIKSVRLRASAFISGTVNVVWVAGVGQNTIAVFSPSAPSFQVSSAPIDATKTTYSASATIATAAAATDILTIAGSGAKTIKVTRLEITGLSNLTAATATVSLIKRSSADTGGVSSSVSAVAHDSTSSAASAAVLAYTANPTLGTTVGALRSAKLTATTAGNNVQSLIWDCGDRPAQALALRGSSEQFAINLGGTQFTSATVSIEWTEE